ncbi:MAG: transpeptidase family protein [Bacteroidales bacterium]|nr:transpeptidase family protein [Bacteroidales bacterium]
MARKKEIKETILKDRDRVSVILTLFYAAFLVISVVIVAKMVWIQLVWDVDPKVAWLFKPKNEKRIDIPVRGSILARDGRLLAISTPLYQVYMDCTVRKGVYADDKKNGTALEAQWREKALPLAEGLASVYGDKTARQYYDLIIQGRDKGSRYVRIGYPIGHSKLQKVKALPLFSEGPNKGGIIVETRDSRQYPYGQLARRVIGYVKDNSRSNGNNRIGIEGKFDYELHGKEGYEWLKVTDDRKMIHNYDSTSVKAVDGMDVRTTLDIDIQDIADKALRDRVGEEPRIQGACAMVMDVSTGAIRAMVNLQRDTTEGSPLQERLNLAIGQVGEQGSVFKTVTLMSLVEDGYVKSLEETIPTNHGVIPYYNTDLHIGDYERATGKNEITVRHGFEISSNYVFTYLATKYYGPHPQEFFNKIYNYRLGDTFDFDLQGLGRPQVTTPSSPGWSRTTLGTAAYGYSIAVTPLHVLTFYNSIANKGRMMKPYLVEDIEKNGVVKKKYGPTVLALVCSRATADTLTRALRAVTEEGTATRLKSARLPVAGKTGTAQVVLSPSEKPRKGDAYHDESGRKKNQGTFVGFFPADNPKYTILVTVYSTLSHTSFYGGTTPALVVRDIVDSIYALEEDWSESITRTKPMPKMTRRDAVTTNGTVPDVKGMGLKDAMYTIENSGFACTYEGSGHVVSQSPAPGAKPSGKEPIKLILK